MCKKIIFLLAVLCLTTAAWSADVKWDGGGDGIKWTDKVNWDGDLEPTAADVAIVEGNNALGLNPDVTLDNVRSATTLTIASMDGNSTSDVTIDGGALTLSGVLNIGKNITGNLNKDKGAVSLSLINNSSLFNAGPDTVINAGYVGTVTTINILNSYANPDRFNFADGGTINFNIENSFVEMRPTNSTNNFWASGAGLSTINIINSTLIQHGDQNYYTEYPNYTFTSTDTGTNSDFRLGVSGAAYNLNIINSELKVRNRVYGLSAASDVNAVVENSKIWCIKWLYQQLATGVARFKVKNSQIICTDYFYYAAKVGSFTGVTYGTFENVVLRSGGGADQPIWQQVNHNGYLKFKHAAIYCEGDAVAGLEARITAGKLRAGGYASDAPEDGNDGIWRGPLLKTKYTTELQPDGFTVLSSVPNKNYPWAFWPHDAMPEGQKLPVTLRWGQGNSAVTQKVYASTDESLVVAKDPGALKATLNADANSFTLPTTGMGPDQKWFWSIASTDVNSNTWTSPPLEILTFDGKAKHPIPANNSISGIDLAGTVQWTVNGTWVNKQHVYYGTDSDAVEAATETVPGAGVTLVTINNGTTNQTGLGILPLVDGSDVPVKYYWRVDGSGTSYSKGTVWNWTMADHYLFDGFETYTDYTTLHNKWTDGDTNSDSGAYINLNTAENPVRSGSKSAVMNLWTDSMLNAIVTRSVPDTAKDWAAKGLASMTLWFHGDPNNAYPTCYANPGDVSKLYVVIDNDADPSNGAKQYYGGNDTDMFVYDWHEWNAALSGFTGVNLDNVVSFGIGVDVEPFAYNASVVIDDIRLYNPRCRPELSGLLADTNADCIVDTDDLEALTADWLKAGLGNVTAATPDASKLIVRYEFNDTSGYTITDSSGKGYNGTYITDDYAGKEPNTVDITGLVDADGKPSNSFHLTNDVVANGLYTTILIPAAAWTDNIGTDGVTVSVWIKNAYTAETSDGTTVLFSARIAPEGDRVFSAEASNNNSRHRLRCMGSLTPFYNTGLWANQTNWTLYTFVHSTMEPNDMAIYADGILVAYKQNADMMGVPTRIYLGAGVSAVSTITDSFTGNIDDFRIYKYGLSPAEVLSLAGVGSHLYKVTDPPANATAELYLDNKIDLKDYSVLGSEWLTQDLWP